MRLDKRKQWTQALNCPLRSEGGTPSCACLGRRQLPVRDAWWPSALHPKAPPITVSAASLHLSVNSCFQHMGPAFSFAVPLPGEILRPCQDLVQRDLDFIISPSTGYDAGSSHRGHRARWTWWLWRNSYFRLRSRTPSWMLAISSGGRSRGQGHVDTSFKRNCIWPPPNSLRRTHNALQALWIWGTHQRAHLVVTLTYWPNDLNSCQQLGLGTREGSVGGWAVAPWSLSHCYWGLESRSL
jgi:hypothetical protein